MPTPALDPTISAAIQVISTVGFPIAVAAYLLVRMDKRLSEMTAAVRDLVEEMRLARTLDRQDRSR